MNEERTIFSQLLEHAPQIWIAICSYVLVAILIFLA